MTQTVLITGAGKRIGASLAEHLASRGHALVLHYRRSKKEASALAARLQKKYRVNISLVQADLSDEKSLARFWKGLPAVTHIIHNASVFERDDLRSLTAKKLRAHLAVHLEAPLLLTQGFLAQLPKGKQGSITILGDGAYGWSVAPQFLSYAVSKHAWVSVIDLLAAAVVPKARANLLQLGPTLAGPYDGKATFNKLARLAPLQRTSSIDDVCAAIDYLLSAKGVTGQTLSLASGMGLSTLRAHRTP